eukprot:SAG31_NODE_18414_length_637_cov_1.040892_1_plen_125_part_00
MGLTSFASEALYGATSFGPAITFNIGWQLCYMVGISDGTITQVSVDMCVMETASALAQMYILHKFIDVKLAVAMVVPTCAFISIGSLLMIQLDSVNLRRTCADQFASQIVFQRIILLTRSSTDS